MRCARLTIDMCIQNEKQPIPFNLKNNRVLELKIELSAEPEETRGNLVKCSC